MTNPNFQRPPRLSGYDLTTTEGCRAAYVALRFYAVKMSHSSPYETNQAFDAAVTGKLAGKENPSPQDFVAAAKRVTWPCKRCASTGSFITYVENGVPKGPGGSCFRCNGKGRQTPVDAHRNYWADVTRACHC